MNHSETSTNSSAPEPQTGQTKSSGRSSHSMAKTQLLQAYFFMAVAPLRLAFAAKTGEGQLAALDLAAGAFSAELRGNRDLMHIHDCVTSVTDKVNVGLCVGIEPFDAVDCGNTCDAALFLKEGQVAINSCLGNVGMGILKHLVYHLGRWVGVCVHQAGQDRIAFSEVLGVRFHRHRPFLCLQVILIYKWIVS